MSKQYIIWYDSTSHGKRRYYRGDPQENPEQDGKPWWTYDQSEATVLNQNQMNVIHGVMLPKCGYKDLHWSEVDVEEMQKKAKKEKFGIHLAYDAAADPDHPLNQKDDASTDETQEGEESNGDDK